MLHDDKYAEYKHRERNTKSGNKVGRKKSISRDTRKTRKRKKNSSIKEVSKGEKNQQENED